MRLAALRLHGGRAGRRARRPALLNDFLAPVFAFAHHLVYRVPMPLGVSLWATVGMPEPLASRTRVRARETAAYPGRIE